MIKEVNIVGVYASVDDIGVRLGWIDDEKGFGEIAITYSATLDSFSIFSECMTKAFVKEVLSFLVDNSHLLD